jgi:hypothetical protein
MRGPMANDPPTNLRMGFGFQQARTAGAPYQRPSTAAQMDFRLKEKKAEKELRKLVESNPASADQVRKLIEKFRSECSVQTILFFAKCSIASRSRYGFVVTGADGKTYHSRKVLEMYGDGSMKIVYEGKPFMLYGHYIADFQILSNKRK